jgi:Domain of unknown function (DUF4395)
MTTNYAAICPVSSERVNEKVARVNALLSVLFILAFLITENIFFALFLMVDFYLRSINNAKYSLIAIASSKLLKMMDVEPGLINAGPKIFAARIGWLFLTITVISFLAGFKDFAFITASVLGVFCFLEAAFGFCLACKLYPFVYNHFYKES